MRVGRSTVAPLWFAVIAGCGASSVPAPTGPTAEQACAARAQAECARRDACSNHFLIGRTYGDVATCVSRLRDACVASLAAPSTAQTAARVQSCAAAYPSIACADYLNGNLPGDCAAQAGALAAGAPCRYSSQCQSAWCAVPTGSQCGVCGAQPMAGAACNGTGASLGCGGRSLVCVGEGEGMPGSCAALLATGATCDAAHPCGAGLSCRPVAVTAMNRTCAAAGSTVGAACGGAMNPGCDNELGLACNGMSRTCQPITLVTAGAACGVGADGGFSSCAAGGDCMGYTPANPHGTCRAAAAPGAACDRAAGPFCATPASCVVAGSGTAGTCQLPSAATCR